MRLYQESYTRGGQRRKTSTWSVEYWIEGRRYRKALKVRDKRAAQSMAARVVAEHERRLANGEDPFADQAQRPVLELVAEWEATLIAKDVNAQHLNDHLRFVKAFVEWSKAGRLRDLDGPTATLWLNAEAERPGRLGAKLSARSLNHRRAALTAFGRWLHMNRRLSHNPFIGLERRKESSDRRRERRAFGDAELSRLFHQVPLYRRALYMTATYTGLRKGELGRLLWQDVDLKGATIRAKASITKNGKEAVIPLPEHVVDVLRELREAEGSAGKVFRLPDYATTRRDFDRVGIPQKTEEGCADFHSFRSTYATLLVRAGVAQSVVTKLMRHSDPRLTLSAYTKLQAEDTRSAVAELKAPGAPVPAPPVERHSLAFPCTSLPGASDEGDSQQTALEGGEAAICQGCGGLVGSGFVGRPLSRVG